jgi:hypothetical protein
MSLSLEELREELEADEPDYAALAARFGPAAIVFLEQLARFNDPMIAPKAIYLAALIPDALAARIVLEAARHQDPRWKVAAAAAAADLNPADASAVVELLLKDADPGVRKTAVQSAPPQPSAALEAILKNAVASDTESYIRELAQKALDRVQR